MNPDEDFTTGVLTIVDSYRFLVEALLPAIKHETADVFDWIASDQFLESTPEVAEAVDDFFGWVYPADA